MIAWPGRDTRIAAIAATAMAVGLAVALILALSIPPADALTYIVFGLRDSYVARTVIAGAIVLGVAGGILGSFAVARGQSLLGDAVSHAALPGIYLMFMAWSLVGVSGVTILGFTMPEPRSLVVVLAGALATGLLATAVVLWAARSTRLHDDAALAVTLSTFFGAGIVLRSLLQARPTAFGSRAGLESFLYGSAATMSRGDVRVLFLLAAVSVIVIILLWKEFKLLSFDPDYLGTLGFPVRKLDGILTGLIVVAVIVGLQMVGVILMSAMLVAPAVAARQWTNRLNRVVLLAAAFGVAGGMVGAVASGSRTQIATGPVIAVYVSALAVTSVLIAPGRGVFARALARRRQRRRFALETLLLHLSHQPAGTSVSQLAKELGWQPRTVLDRMHGGQRAGWLDAGSPEIATLNEAGRAKVAAMLSRLDSGEVATDGPRGPR